MQNIRIIFSFDYYIASGSQLPDQGLNPGHSSESPEP